MKFFLLKLGCPKNDVDADYISTRLIEDGHKPTTDPEKAHSIIINTCGFIQAAKEESINEILKLSLLKNSGHPKTLYATGCLSQRYGKELLRGIPELDGVFGIGEIDALLRAVESSSRLVKPVFRDARRLDYLCGDRRHITDNLPYAYLKISDGCNRLCSFCAIPFIRGKYRSRPLKAVADEARFLADHGKKEIIIVSQEATHYGHDIKDGSNIINLLQELEKIEKISWIRLLYLYPDRVNKELIDYMAQSPKVLKYFDLPLQHINDEILKRMRRRTSRRQIEQLLFNIKTIIPEAVLRTTFIVGFPGESKKEFKELRTFIETYRFDRVGVFSFSLEEGTAAAKMRPLVSEKVKNTRLDNLMSLQQEIAFAKNNSLIGANKKVIIDSSDDSRMARGRTEADCPDIDQEIVIHGKNLKAGDIRIVKITGSDSYDLVGEVLQG